MNLDQSPVPDSTSNNNNEANFKTVDDAIMITPTKSGDLADSTVKSSQSSPELTDLVCKEVLANDSVDEEEDFNDERILLGSAGIPSPDDGTTGYSRTSSPLSAVDIFADYKTNILQAIFDEAENNMDSSFNSILVS